MPPTGNGRRHEDRPPAALRVPLEPAASPAHVGGPINRGAPCYGEDDEWVLGELLGMSKADMARLGENDVIRGVATTTDLLRDLAP